MKTPAYKNFRFWQDYSKVRVSLNRISSIFYALAQLGTVYLDNNVPTFSLSYNTDGYALDWRINLRFWKHLTREQKQFFICHECLHFLLEHGKRLDLDDPISNIAADIVVNEMLFADFSFSKEDLGNLYFQLCLVETICPEVGYGFPVEHYVKELKKLQEQGEDGDLLGFAPSNHISGHKKERMDIIDQKVKRSFEELLDKSSRTERQKFQKHTHAIQATAGTESGGLIQSVCVNSNTKAQNRWLRVIKEKVSSFSTKESWAVLNRRIAFFKTDVFIPTEFEEESNNGRINLLFYIDSSGSCWDFAQRFVQAAETIPRSKFNVEIFTFDVDVYPYTKNTVFGGGGTSLQAVVDHAQSRSFKAAFVLTDGEGSAAFPKEKKKWSWFITEDGTSSFIFGGGVYPLSEYA